MLFAERNNSTLILPALRAHGSWRWHCVKALAFLTDVISTVAAKTGAEFTAQKHFYNRCKADQCKHCVCQALLCTINVKAHLLPVRYVVAEPSFERWPFATQLSPLTTLCPMEMFL